MITYLRMSSAWHKGMARPRSPRSLAGDGEVAVGGQGLLSARAAAKTHHYGHPRSRTPPAWSERRGAHLESVLAELPVRSDPTDVAGARRADVARVDNDGRAGIGGRDRQ